MAFAMRVSGNYDGIGADGFEAYGARVWFDIPLSKPSAPAPPPAAPPNLRTCPNGRVVAAGETCPAAPDDMNAQIEFLDGKSNLTSGAYMALASLWEGASQNDIASIAITAAAENASLAQRRADAIAAALQQLGAPAGLMSVSLIEDSAHSLVTIAFH